jgi:N-methylhydantoinase A/oxoprolinase/acetone carboxylase beta subunit
MMPWRKDHAEESDTLSAAHRHDYLCCHTDIRGLQFNRHVLVDSGAKIEEFHKFGRVYSGHIHFAQEAKNIKMLGSPYELTRSDLGNRKSITLLDLESGEETEFENDFSPKFIKIGFDQVLEKTPAELEILFRNNFVDVLIDPKLAVKASLGILTEMVATQLKTTFTPIKDPIQAEQNLEDALFSLDGKSFSIVDFADEYINALDEPDEVKEKMKKTIKILYKRTTDKEAE